MVDFSIDSDKEHFTPAKIKEYNSKFREAYSAEENQEIGLKMEDEKASIQMMEVDGNTLLLGLDTKFGYVSFDIDLDKNIDFLVKIVELSVKKLNKFKTILEAL